MNLIRPGDSGPHVSCLQRALRIAVSGTSDPATVVAIRRLQESKGLKVDGICGPMTWAAIRGFAVEYSDALTHWGRRQLGVAVIVVHHSGGYSREGMERTLNSKKCATNALVMQTGKRVIYGDPATDLASHAKVINARSLGLDFEHAPGEAWPAVQIQAGGALIAAWCREYGLQPTINPARAWDGSADHPCRTVGRYTDSGEVIEYPRPRIDPRYGVGLHRHYGATRCPDTLPLDELQRQILAHY